MWHQKPALVDNAQKISTVRAAMPPRENKGLVRISRMAREAGKSRLTG
jgi:hypothetical protein